MINREQLVKRHHPHNREIDPLSPLTVGNGSFAFTADITGLQSLPQAYEKGIPLCTQAQWGWHSFPLPSALKGQSFQYKTHRVGGREHGYMTSSEGQEALYQYLRENPHRLHLGQIGLVLKNGKDLAAIAPEALSQAHQELSLWEGLLTSRFTCMGQPAQVTTCCHPEKDILAVRIVSPLLASGELGVSLVFPYGSGAMSAADWTQPEKHFSHILKNNNQSYTIERTLDNDRYFCRLRFVQNVMQREPEPHRFVFTAAENELSFSVCFSPVPPTEENFSFPQTAERCRAYWQSFWIEGGAVELAGSTDPRAPELERRIVLSQYLLAVQCAGELPPQETGLTCNSWYGKFHLEMHWWHAAQFAVWGRISLLKKSLGWYRCIAGTARKQTEAQGYRGIRWPKMTGPDGQESPSPIGPYLIWQQPHFIYFAELLYRYDADQSAWREFAPLVEATAEFMADYAYFEKETGRYVLGPILIPAQENHDPEKVLNPTYELEYWRWGLETAQAWRERTGQKRNPQWDEILKKLAPLPVDPAEQVYLAHERCPETFTNLNVDHPSMLCALGGLPGVSADRKIMKNTLEKAREAWHWSTVWGWDFPVCAMTAARLGEPALALDFLLMDTPKNTYLPNGHNYQTPDLPLYLPGNGGLLSAVALLCAGWEGQENTPGFPRDGSWKVRWENLKPLL